MTKILHIPSGQILTFKAKNTTVRTPEYEKSVYVTDHRNSFSAHIAASRKCLPLKTAYQFVLSMCNKDNINRHMHFKDKFKIDKFCSVEEFEIIQ